MVRDDKGRFVVGNKAGKGRRPRAEEREIVTALNGAIPLIEVLAKLRAAILAGEDWAIKLYLAYTWHLPTQPVKADVDGMLKVVVVYDDSDDSYEETACESEEDSE